MVGENDWGGEAQCQECSIGLIRGINTPSRNFLRILLNSIVIILIRGQMASVSMKAPI